MVKDNPKDKILNDKNRISYHTRELQEKKHHNESLIIAIKYGLFSILWILLSDHFIDLLIDQSVIYRQLQRYKDWLYVFLTMILIYRLTRNSIKWIYNNFNKNIAPMDMDNTEQRKYEESIKHMASYDSLTGLANRFMFENEIDKRIKKQVEKPRFAIAYMDLDNFKYINDTLGHQVGNEFLKYIGNNIKNSITVPNIVARLGGDEFAILFTEVQSKELLLESIQKIKNNISRIWSIQNQHFFVSMSIGIVIYPDNGKDSTILLKNADIAMYAAKQQGKDRILLYTENIREKNSGKIQMANKLQSGIENQEFRLFYQPQYKLDTGEIIGVEALIRWIHPEEGFISPAEFIPIAEETGQIYSIEQWIFKTALQQKKQWEEEGFHHIELSINLSAKTLISDINFKTLETLIDTFSIDYSKVSIEITETAVISNINLVINRLKKLKKKGLKIALDDFGTGYSSLTYLKELPIDSIKLDRSFIRLIPYENMDTVIVKNILSMAHDLKYQVVAEGIETKEQLEYLKEYYCESGQGFLMSKPLPIEQMNKLIKAH